MNYPYSEPSKKSKPRSRAWMIILPLCIFAITLAMLVARRMDPEAQAVLAGAVCGVVAAIPASALATVLIIKARQRDDEAKEASANAPASPYDYRGLQPPIIIQNVPPPQPATWPQAPVEWNQRPARQFTQIGGGATGNQQNLMDLDD